ncbi:MAG: hypothetical protein IT243_00745 [Bacteroidia bacterium]|nr:hypothetical protein [Bacteroidia bacterium]
MKSQNQLLNFAFILFVVTLLSACYNEDNSVKIPSIAIGFKPVYVDSNTINEVIYSTNPRVLVKPGKIFKYGKMLLISDENKGIHVIDNSDKINPIKKAFINIPGNIDLARKGNYLYADCNGNLVTIDISDPLNAKVTSIINTIQISKLRPTNDLMNKYFPNESRVFYECADERKGILLSWEKDTIYKPECYLGYSRSFEE